MSRQRHNQNMLSTTTPSLSKDEALVCTREKDKFLQFARLIMVGCNDLFRELFNYLCPPEMLPGNVDFLVKELPRLNQHERKCLYPSTGRSVTSDDFDISLLFKLLKVIFLEQPDGGWDKLPKNTDHKISDELVRIKYYRDEICHESYNKEISNDLFLELWEYIKGAMIRIAECLPRGSEWWELRIDEFSRAPLTLAEEELAEELNQWYLNDLDVKKLLLESMAEIKADLKKLLKERPLTGEDKELSEETSFAGPAQKRPLTEKDKELSEETSAAGPAQKRPLTEEDKELSEETSFAGPAQKRPLTEKDKELSEETSAAGPAQKRPLTGEDKELSEETSFAGPAQKRPLTEKDKELSEETSAAGPAQKRPLTEEDKELSEETSFAGPAQKRPLTEKDKELSEETSAAGPAQRQAEKRTNPLHVAAKKGNIKMIRLMLPRFEIDSLDECGRTPLMLAATFGKKAAFGMLIRNGADPHLKCSFGECLLHFAAEGGNTHILRHLLLLNLDVNQRNDVGVTPLATAAIWGKQRAFKLLLENNANEFLISKDGYSVLHFAAFNGSVPIIRKLILRGLDPNLEDRFGITPLITAAEESKCEAVQYLVSIGAK
ncbi:hypothetical protein ABFA07_004677 [Porites harrisoni]